MDLREARFKTRISQWELAKQTGVFQSRISLIENGHPAKEKEKVKISKALNLLPDRIDWPQAGFKEMQHNREVQEA